MTTLQEKQKEFREASSAVAALLADLDSPDSRERLEAALEKAESLKSDIDMLKRAEGLDEWSRGVSFAPTGDAVTVGLNPDPDATTKAYVCDEGGELTQTLRKTLEPSYKAAFMRFMRRREDQADLKALAEGRDVDGGVLVPADIASEILVRRPHPTAVLGAVNRVRTSKDVLQFMRLEPTAATSDTVPTGVRVQWSGEAGTTTEDTAMQNWGTKRIPVFTGSFDIRASRDLIEDAEVDLQAFLVDQAKNVYELDAAENSIVNGNGVGRPSGILRAVGTAYNPGTTNVGNPVSKNGLMSLLGALAPQYRRNGMFLCDSTTVWTAIAQLDTGTGGGLIGWRSQIAGLAAPFVEQLAGYQALFSAYMPSAGSGNNIAVYGDFKEGYYWVERVGLTAHPYGQSDGASLRANQVGWVFRFRVGGDVMNYRALRVGVQS
jgi:HK97 family phage major capsid protein